MNQLNYFLVVVCLVVLAIMGVVANSATSPPVTAQASYADGSVLFWKDGLLVKPINRHTGSDITHAAVVLGGYVYEAVPPCVRKVPVEQYLKEMKAKQAKRSMQRRGFTFFIIQPKRPYLLSSVVAMTVHAESQLGRPYMLRGWWKGHEVRGIFCSQLVSDVLAEGGRIKSGNVKESPGSLYQKLKGLYQ